MIFRARIAACVVLAIAAAALPAETAPKDGDRVADQLGKTLTEMEKSSDSGSIIKGIAIITVLSIAPAILVMVTSFTRVAVVLGLLRQALATQQLPPNQILFGLALLITVVVMAPVYNDVHNDAIAPYLDGRITQAEAISAGEGHVRGFMIRQIESGGNVDDVYLFLPEKLAARKDLAWKDVPTTALIPGFVISELKIAFLIGFRIFLPFLIIDMLVASVLVSMGMLMLPPVFISLPFKLLLFVLADGWHLVVGTLMTSFT